MAISAVAITTTDTLETFRVEFNNLVADVASVEQVGASNIIIADGGNIGSASDQDALSIASTGVVTFSQAPSFTTGLSVSDLDIDGGTDIGAAIVDADLFIIDDGASGTNRKTAASRLLTYAMTGTLTAAAQTGITSVGTLTALQVDNINVNGNTITASSGAVNITPAGGSAIVLDGTVNVDAGVVTGVTSLTSNNILIADGGTIGAASSTSAITVASTGIVTFVDDILIKDGGTIGNASVAAVMTLASTGIVTLVDDLILKDAATIGVTSSTSAISIASTGIVTFVDDILIKDGGTIGAASATTAITIASTGIVTLVDDLILKDAATIGVTSSTSAISIASTGIVTFVDDIIIKDAGTIGSASVPAAISISSGGVVDIAATTANTSASDGALTVAGGLGVGLDLTIGGGDLRLITDASIMSFGVNSEITLTHVHDVGLTITNTINGTDDRPVVLQLKSEEDAIAAADVIASLEFAAGDSDGTDGATVAAGIHAIAEGTFAADANATKLVFTTGVSETAAAGATAKMTLSSAGLLTIADDFLIKDAGTIGNASVAAVMTLASTGIVTFADDILIKDGGTIGAASAATAITIASSGIITLVDDLILKDAATIGVTSSTSAITIASTGIVTFVDDIVIKDAGTIGSASAAGAIAISSGGIVTFVDDILIKDGGTIGAASATTAITIASSGIITLVDDLILKDAATIGVTSSTSAITIASTGIVTLVDDLILKDAATIGVTSSTSAITIASTGIVTLVDDLILKDAATIGVTSSTSAISIAATGIVTFVDDILIKDAGTIGSASAAGAIAISAAGIVTFVDDILIKDGGTIGVASDADSITIASDGQVTLSQDLTIVGELATTGFSSESFAAAKVVMDRSAADGTDAGDNIIDETDSDNILMENVTSWVTSGFTIRDSFGNHLQTVNGVS